MTVSQETGAPAGSAQSWRAIDWQKAWREVKRLQVRIAKATQEGRHGKVKALQWTLTHSFYAKALAVKRVTSNKGKKTPGGDGVLWQGARAKVQAMNRLHRRGYRAQPLRRIYIPKKNGKRRPLSIPTMYDRAMQALYKLALVPVAETTADRNSYGFREGRSCADAIVAAFNALNKPNSATWVAEMDITGCYDNIAHSWMLDNIPIDRRMLTQWLKAGYVEGSVRFPTRKGTPQGGIISPVPANMTLDGMEAAVLRAVPWRSRVNFIRYADDFMVTGKSKTILERYVLPTVEEFLANRGLSLSRDKTRITHVRDGVTFLGQAIRRDGRVLHITPSKESVRSLMRKVGTLIRKYTYAPIYALISKLNGLLRGWGNYHRHVVSSETFGRVDRYVIDRLWKAIRKRHPKRSMKWLTRHYWTAAGRKGTFSSYCQCNGKKKLYQVHGLSSIAIRRHIKVRADANPYNAEHRTYFAVRKCREDARLRSDSCVRQQRKRMKAQRG